MLARTYKTLVWERSAVVLRLLAQLPAYFPLPPHRPRSAVVPAGDPFIVSGRIIAGCSAFICTGSCESRSATGEVRFERSAVQPERSNARGCGSLAQYMGQSRMTSAAISLNVF